MTMTEPQRLWSVTTLISAGLGKGDALIGWAARVTAERAYDRAETLQSYRNDNDRAGGIKFLTEARWEKSGSAAARGVEVHRILEQYALGQQPDFPEEFAPYDVQVRKYLDEWQPEFIAAEAPVYNLTFGYAGTLDSIQKLPGVDLPLIVDCKTTDKAPPELDPTVKSRPPYSEIALQLCAYSRAEVLGVNPPQMTTQSGRRYYLYDPAGQYEPLPELGGALALVISPYDYRLVPVRIDEEVWAAFAHVREAARWQLDISRRVIGPPLTAHPQQEVLPV